MNKDLESLKSYEDSKNKALVKATGDKEMSGSGQFKAGQQVSDKAIAQMMQSSLTARSYVKGGDSINTSYLQGATERGIPSAP